MYALSRPIAIWWVSFCRETGLPFSRKYWITCGMVRKSILSTGSDFLGLPLGCFGLELSSNPTSQVDFNIYDYLLNLRRVRYRRIPE